MGRFTKNKRGFCSKNRFGEDDAFRELKGHLGGRSVTLEVTG